MTSSYHFSESSPENGTPTLAIDFYCAANNSHWSLTTAPYDIILDRQYTQQPGLVDGPLKLEGNALRTTWELTVPDSCTLAAEYLTDPPPGPVAVTARRGHVDANYDYQTFGVGTFGAGIFGGHTWDVYWRGFVLALTWKERGAVLIKCVPTVSELGLAGACPRWGRQCQVPLYSTPCGVDKADYAASVTVSALDGLTVTATAFGTPADGYFTGGLLVAADARQRTIVSHSGTVVTLSRAWPSLAVGDVLTAYPGCDHLYDGDCLNVFDNVANNRGQPQLPDRNPSLEGIF